MRSACGVSARVSLHFPGARGLAMVRLQHTCARGLVAMIRPRHGLECTDACEFERHSLQRTRAWVRKSVCDARMPGMSAVQRMRCTCAACLEQANAESAGIRPTHGRGHQASMARTHGDGSNSKHLAVQSKPTHGVRGCLQETGEGQNQQLKFFAVTLLPVGGGRAGGRVAPEVGEPKAQTSLAACGRDEGHTAPRRS